MDMQLPVPAFNTSAITVICKTTLLEIIFVLRFFVMGDESCSRCSVRYQFFCSDISDPTLNEADGAVYGKSAARLSNSGPN